MSALQGNIQWIIKQLLITHDSFSVNERAVFNYYYIEDYIRYLQNTEVCPQSHLQMLAHNLKNVLFDIFKKNVGLGLQELETELLKELITDIHVGTSSTSEDESAGSDTDSSTSSDNTSTSSESDEDSVIEQKMDNLKLV